MVNTITTTEQNDIKGFFMLSAKKGKCKQVAFIKSMSDTELQKQVSMFQKIFGTNKFEMERVTMNEYNTEMHLGSRY